MFWSCEIFRVHWKVDYPPMFKESMDSHNSASVSCKHSPAGCRLKISCWVIPVKVHDVISLLFIYFRGFARTKTLKILWQCILFNLVDWVQRKPSTARWQNQCIFLRLSLLGGLMQKYFRFFRIRLPLLLLEHLRHLDWHRLLSWHRLLLYLRLDFNFLLFFFGLIRRRQFRLNWRSVLFWDLDCGGMLLILYHIVIPIG